MEARLRERERYSLPYRNKACIILVRNALHVNTMYSNILLRFFLRESVIQLNDTPNIKMEYPTIEDHTIVMREAGLNITLKLWGVF